MTSGNASIRFSLSKKEFVNCAVAGLTCQTTLQAGLVFGRDSQLKSNRIHEMSDFLK